MRWISITAIGSTPANGSSSRMKRGCVASARAISTRRRSPPDSAGAGESRSFSMLRSRSSCSSRRSISALRSARPSAPSCSSSTARMFSCDRQLAKDRRFLRQVRQAQPRALVDRLALHRLAVDADLAGVGAHQADHHVEGRGLAGAVGPEQPDHFAGADRQVHVLDHLARAVASFAGRSTSRRLASACAAPAGASAVGMAGAATHRSAASPSRRCQRRVQRRSPSDVLGCSAGAAAARRRRLPDRRAG